MTQTIDKIPLKIQAGLAVALICSLLAGAWVARGMYDNHEARLCAIEAEAKKAGEERAAIKASNHTVEIELKRIGTDVLWIRKELEKK